MKNFFKNLTFKDYVIALLCIACIGLGIAYHHYYNKSSKYIIMNDSIEVYKNKLNEEYIAKKTYVLTIDLLKETNKDLYTEYKNLKDNPLVITKSYTTVKIDSIEMSPDTIFVNPKDTTYNLLWSTTNEYFNVSGTTFVKYDFSKYSTVLNTFRMDANITTDITEDDNQLRILVKSSNPYINITNTDGVVLDPTKSKVLKSYFKQKKFAIGPQLGFGLTGDMKFRPFIGVGITYGIIHF